MIAIHKTKYGETFNINDNNNGNVIFIHTLFYY